MTIVFMGTPEFAVPSLDGLVAEGYTVLAAVTQADRPKGRGHTLAAPPVKERALALNIPVLQPDKLSRQPEYVEMLAQLKPDLMVTCAFGQMLPKSVLDIPRYGTINVHGSLLPKYRGAAPIQWAVINGDKVTGITTMFTDIGMDTGDMLLKEEIAIPDNMTSGELHDKMSHLGARVLIRTLKAMENGTLVRTPQNADEATHAPKMEKTTGQVDWTKTSLEIHNLVRGTSPWPGAFSYFCDCKMRIWSSKIIPDPGCGDSCPPGTILSIEENGMSVKTGDGALLINEIQSEAKKRMTPRQYACGNLLKCGMSFAECELNGKTV